MIFSKANLRVGAVASKDAMDRGLHGVRLEEDGSTVAMNGRVLMAVGPADSTKAMFPEKAAEQITTGREGLLLPIDFLEKVVRGMAKSTKPMLQYVALSRVKDMGRIGMTSVNERGDSTTHACLPKHEPFPDWRKIVRGLVRRCRGGHRICLNRQDLIDLLKALEQACPNKGDANPVFMELSNEGDGAVLRCKNHETGQHAIGVINAYDTRGHWMERDQWERRTFAEMMKRKIRAQ